MKKSSSLIVNPCICDTYKGYFKAYAEIKYSADGRLSICGVIGPTRNGNCYGGAGQCVDDIRHGKPSDDWTREMLNKFCDIWEKWHFNDMRASCSHQRELGWDKIGGEKVNYKPSDTNYKPTVETKLKCHTYESEGGILCKPCPICGYRYGSKWLKENVPDDVLDFLFSLPKTKTTPAWV